MNYFKEDWIALLEYNGRHEEKQWHYNYGEVKPETYGWQGVLWYNRKDEDTCRYISEFCNCIDNAFKHYTPSYRQVKRLAEFFAQCVGDKAQIKVYNRAEK